MDILSLNDLRDTFAHVKLKVSLPMIPFRKTVVAPPTVDMVNEAISSDNETRLVTNPSNASNADGSVTIVTAN